MNGSCNGKGCRIIRLPFDKRIRKTNGKKTRRFRKTLKSSATIISNR